MEFLFWLKKVNYVGWHSLDIYPYRENPTKPAAECLKQIKFGLNALDKIGYSKMLDVVKSGNPIKFVEMLREISWVTYIICRLYAPELILNTATEKLYTGEILNE